MARSLAPAQPLAAEMLRQLEALVLMLVVFTSLFFLVVDEVLRTIVSLALGFGRGG